MSDSTITKKAIAAALKELCHKKTFDKITVADITGTCGLNRQSFYYHFQDKYELLSWIYCQEGFIKVTEGIRFDNWDQRLLELLQTMLQEKAFYRNVLAADEGTFTDYLYEITYRLFYEAAEKIDVRQQLKEESKKFFAQFNAYGICGVVVDWVKAGMREPPEQLAAHLKRLVHDSKQLAVGRFAEHE